MPQTPWPQVVVLRVDGSAGPVREKLPTGSASHLDHSVIPAPAENTESAHGGLGTGVLGSGGAHAPSASISGDLSFGRKASLEFREQSPKSGDSPGHVEITTA